MDEKDRVLLGGISRNYWYFAGKGDLVKRMLEKHPSSKDQRILVAGCGHGIEVEIAKEHGTVSILDKDQKALDSFDGVEKICLDMETENIQGSFHVIFALDLLEHITNDMIALDTLRSSLIAGGSIFVSVPAHKWLWSPHDEHLEHIRRYDKGDLQKKFNVCGFKDFKITYWMSFLSIPVILLRLIKKGSGSKGSDLKRIPSPINIFLKTVIILENRIRELIDIPFGLSLIVEARK